MSRRLRSVIQVCGFSIGIAAGGNLVDRPLSFWGTVWAVAFGQILAGVLLITVSFFLFFGVLALGCAAAIPDLPSS